jgi:hypothetical protein
MHCWCRHWEKLFGRSSISLTTYHLNQQFHSEVYIPQRIRKRCSNKYLHMNIHSSIFLNSKKVETTQTSINRWINKIWHTHNEILFGHENEWSADA